MNSRWIKWDIAMLVPMLAAALLAVLLTATGIAYLDAKVIIIKQDAAIRFGIVNNTALMLKYVKLERACGDIVLRGNRHE